MVKSADIVQPDGDQVGGAKSDVGRHIKDKGREPALVFAHEYSVHPHIRHQKSAVELEKIMQARIGGGYGKIIAVPANALEIGRAGLPIRDVPRVRQVQVRPGGIIVTDVRRIGAGVREDEPPVRIHDDILAAVYWRRVRLRGGRPRQHPQVQANEPDHPMSKGRRSHKRRAPASIYVFHNTAGCEWGAGKLLQPG